MEYRILKDFVIVLGVLIIIGAATFDYLFVFRRLNLVPERSKYENSALSDELLTSIQDIEKSIQDRKEFRFTIDRDPLEQNLIVKTKRDLEKIWKEEVERTLRLTTTLIDQDGKSMASFAYNGKNTVCRVGDEIIGRKITAIRSGEVDYVYNGVKGQIKVSAIPPKPVEISDKQNKTREYNW